MRALIALFSLFAFVLPAAAAEKFEDPVKLVEYAYQRYTGEPPAGFNEMDLYTPRLQALFKEEEARGELGGLVFDPYLNSQEQPDLSDLSILLAVANEKKALVAVGFTNGDSYEQMMFTLLPGPDGYKIDEIQGAVPGNEWVLSDVLAKPL
jgi:hypothetical protein